MFVVGKFKSFEHFVYTLNNNNNNNNNNEIFVKHEPLVYTRAQHTVQKTNQARTVQQQ